MNVYLVGKFYGPYCDYSDRIIGAFANRESAEGCIRSQTIKAYTDNSGEVYSSKNDKTTPWPVLISPQRRYDLDDWEYPGINECDTPMFRVIEMEVQE